MSSHLYELGVSRTTGAAAGQIASIVPLAIAAGVQPPEIREIGIFNASGVAAEVGIGYPAAVGVTPTTLGTVQLSSGWLNTGDTTLATYATSPTAPTAFMRRFPLQSAIGAGVIFTWTPNEWVLWAGAAIPSPVIWQISALAVTYDLYIKVSE